MTKIRMILAPVGLLLTLSACGADPDAEFARAQDNFTSHDYPSVRLDLMNALKERPDDIEMITMLARTELALGNGEAAIVQIDRLETLGGQLPDGQLFRAEAQVRGGHPDKAIMLLDGKDSAEAARIRALALIAQEKYDDARDAMKAGLDGSGPKDRLYSDYAQYLLADGDTAQAEKYASMALKSSPQMLDPMIASAKVATVNGDLERALSLFETARENYPNSKAATVGQIRTLGQLGRVDEAAPLIEAAFARSGNDIEIIYLKARLEAEEENWGEIRQLLQGRERELRYYPDAQLLYAQSLLEEGQMELAHAILKRLNLLFPQHPDGAGLLAEVEIERGDKAGALQVLQPFIDRGDAPAKLVSLYRSAQ